MRNAIAYEIKGELESKTAKQVDYPVWNAVNNKINIGIMLMDNLGIARWKIYEPLRREFNG